MFEEEEWVDSVMSLAEEAGGREGNDENEIFPICSKYDYECSKLL